VASLHVYDGCFGCFTDFALPKTLLSVPRTRQGSYTCSIHTQTALCLEEFVWVVSWTPHQRACQSVSNAVISLFSDQNWVSPYLHSDCSLVDHQCTWLSRPLWDLLGCPEGHCVPSPVHYVQIMNVSKRDQCSAIEDSKPMKRLRADHVGVNLHIEGHHCHLLDVLANAVS
jgi:hypothetical protein